MIFSIMLHSNIGHNLPGLFTTLSLGMSVKKVELKATKTPVARMESSTIWNTSYLIISQHWWKNDSEAA